MQIKLGIGINFISVSVEIHVHMSVPKDEHHLFSWCVHLQKMDFIRAG